MKLLDYMRTENIDDDGMAALINAGLADTEKCSGYAVKKWKYGEREPDASTIVRIERATAGHVTVADWAEQASERPRGRASA